MSEVAGARAKYPSARAADADAGAVSLRQVVAALWPAALALCGFAATLLLFWPGLMSHDAAWVHAVARGETEVGDWQSPVMAMLWRLIDPLAPGPGSMLALVAALYWLGIALVAQTVARRAPIVALALIAAALTPPALTMLGVIWRDMLIASLWLAAVGLVLTSIDLGRRASLALRGVALAFIVLGALLRPNAIPPGAVLALYAIWPTRFEWRRTALLVVPAVALLFAISHVTYYGVFNAVRQDPLHSLFVFDLGGVTHYSGENAFPVEWTDAEHELLTTQCYQADMWDRYWYMPPCHFVMARLEADGLFHSSAMGDAWRDALIKYPLAYLRHRAAYMATFLFEQNQTLPVSRPGLANASFAPGAVYRGYDAAHEWLKVTPLFRAGFWFAVCGVLCVFAWPRRETPTGAFALAAAGSAVVYVALYAVLGVAPDFRYAYWSVPAALCGTAVLVAQAIRRT